MFARKFISFFSHYIEHAFEFTDTFKLTFELFICIFDFQHIAVDIFEIGHSFMKLLTFKICFF